MSAGHPNAIWGIFQFIGVCFCFVGYGFVWIFPSHVALYSSTYFMVYQLGVVFLGVPFYYVSLKLGCITQSGIILIFRKHAPVISGIGIACVIKLFLSSLYIQVYASYFIYYCFTASVEQNPFRWSKIYNDTEPGFSTEEQFFLRNSLQISDGIDKPGPVVSHLGSSLFLAWLFTFLITLGGIRYFGKIMMFMAITGVAAIIAVMAYGREEFILPPTYQDRPYPEYYFYHSNLKNASATLEDSLETLRSDWTSCIYHVVIWSMMWHGVLPTLGKCVGPTKVKFHLSWVILLVVLTVIPHLFVNMIAPYVVTFSMRTNVDLKTLLGAHVYEGKLPFVILPTILTDLGLKRGISFLIYLVGFLFVSQMQALLCMVVIDNVYEIFRPLTKRFIKSSKITSLVMAGVYCVLGLFLSLPMVCQGGYYLLVLVENWIDKWLVFLILISLIAYVITFVGQDFHLAEKILMMIWFIASSIVVMVIVGYYAAFQHERSHRYTFSSDKNQDGQEKDLYLDWAYAMGWLIALGPLVVGLVIGFVISAVKEKEQTKIFCQKCVVRCCLVADGFSGEVHMEEYSGNRFTNTMVSNHTMATTLGRDDGDYMSVENNSHHSSRISDRPDPHQSPIDYAY